MAKKRNNPLLFKQAQPLNYEDLSQLERLVVTGNTLSLGQLSRVFATIRDMRARIEYYEMREDEN